MTQLPTPVVQTEFGGLVTPFLNGLRATGAAIDLAAGDQQRAVQKTEMEHRVDAARAKAVAFDDRIEAGTQRVMLDSMKIEYAKAVDEERRGMMAVLANDDEDTRAKYLREHPFLDRGNQAYAMQLHGQTVAGLDINGAQAAVLKHFAGGGKAEGIKVSNLMDDALENRAAMPAEALIAYQNHFIPQVRGMIRDQATRASNKRQASLEDRADTTVNTQTNMFVNGTATWESVLTEWEKLKKLHSLDAQPGELDLYNMVASQFTQSLPNFAGNYQLAREKWESMPEEVRAANPQVPTQIQKTEDQYNLVQHNRMVQEFLETATTLGIDPDANSVAMMQNLRKALPKAMLEDTLAMVRFDARVKAAIHKNEDVLALMDDGISAAAADRIVKDVNHDFGPRYNGSGSVDALVELKNARGIGAAVNRVNKLENAQSAISLLYADKDVRPLLASALEKYTRLREQLDPWMAFLHKEIKEVGDPQDNFWLRREGKPSVPSREQIEELKQGIVISAALKFAGDDTQDSQALIEAELARAIGHTWGDTHVDIDGKAVRDTWIDASGNSARRHNNPRAWWGKSAAAEEYWDSVSTTARSVRSTTTGAKPNLHGMFQWADDNTYTPIVGGAGVVAFHKWDPTGQEKPEHIYPDSKNWDVIRRHYEAVVPEAQRVLNGDWSYGSHIPSPYIRTADQIMFPGGEQGGYWERGLKPEIHQMWLEQNTEQQIVPPDREPPAGSPPEVVEAWKEDMREYLMFEGDQLEKLGWQRLIDAPKPPKPNVPRSNLSNLSGL